MNVLIVDDDIATVDVICKSVNWNALQIDTVLTAYNISKAKDVFAETTVDIVLCDIEMPMGYGTELLQWARENEITSEFLLLTCHTEFQYASIAIRYQVAGYLLKPFRVEQVEVELSRLIQKIKEKQKIEKESHYGKWVRNHQEQMLVNFWRALMERELSTKPELLKLEIKKRGIPVALDQSIRLICVRVTREEQARKELGYNLLEFTLEKMVSEIIDESIENISVIRKIINEGLYFIVTDWKQTAVEALYDRCRMLIKTARDYVGCSLTCYIGEECSIERFPDEADEVIRVLSQNVLDVEKVFRYGEVRGTQEANTKVLDLKELEKDLQNKNKMKVLNTIKDISDKFSREHNMSLETLMVMQQEILQLIYTHLYKNGIQAAELFGDEVSRKLQRQSTRSVFYMIKWVNYAVSRTLEYEDEITRSLSLADKIESYVKEHYRENISRETIAAAFFLTPEYLAKVYKRQAGHNLKDYINTCRIEMARQLLEDASKSISDISVEVGFDNFSYFSTVFKKYTGITPGEYRKIKSS